MLVKLNVLAVSRVKIVNKRVKALNVPIHARTELLKSASSTAIFRMPTFHYAD